MVNVRLSYNPYLVRTTIEVNGKHPESKSKLNIPAGVRLQEWVDDLPRLLTKDYNDKIDLKFIGTKLDFEDVKIAFKESGVTELMYGKSLGNFSLKINLPIVVIKYLPFCSSVKHVLPNEEAKIATRVCKCTCLL